MAALSLNADRKPAAATHPILGWDGLHWVPAPRKLRDVVWILATPLQVAGSKCEKAVFRRCSAARPSLGTELHGSQCAPKATCSSQDYRVLNMVLSVPSWGHGSSQDYTFVQRDIMINAICHNRWL